MTIFKSSRNVCFLCSFVSSTWPSVVFSPSISPFFFVFVRSGIYEAIILGYERLVWCCEMRKLVNVFCISENLNPAVPWWIDDLLFEGDRAFLLSSRRAPCRFSLSRCWWTVPGVSAITAVMEARSGEHTSGSWNTEASLQQRLTEPIWEWWDDFKMSSNINQAQYWMKRMETATTQIASFYKRSPVMSAVSFPPWTELKPFGIFSWRFTIICAFTCSSEDAISTDVKLTTVGFEVRMWKNSVCCICVWSV